MLVDLDVSSRAEAISALACAMEQNKFIANADSLVAAALERESVLSTAEWIWQQIWELQFTLL